MLKSVNVFSLVLMACVASEAGAARSPWDTSLDFCLGVSSPKFQQHIGSFKEKIKAGKTWQKSIALEKKELNKMVKETCPAFLANPNGHVTLAKFRTEFERLGERAIETKQNSDDIIAYFDAETKEADKFYLGAGVDFDSFPCAKGMKVLKDQMVKEESVIRTQFTQLVSKCSAIASAETDKIIGNAESAAPTGKGAPELMKKKTQKRESTITGDIEGQPAPKK